MYISGKNDKYCIDIIRFTNNLRQKNSEEDTYFKMEGVLLSLNI